MISINTEQKLIGFRLQGCEHTITQEQARFLIALLESRLGSPFVAKVKQVVGDAYGYTSSELDSHERTERLCLARFVCYRLCRDSGMSSQEIADNFGGRDHATVLHGLSVLKDKMDLREPLRREIDLLRERVGMNGEAQK